MRSNARGMSLISVMIAIGMAGVLAVIIGSLFSNMSSLSTRSLQLSDADNIVRYLKGVLARPATCNGALRGTGPAFDTLVWANAAAPQEVFRIQIGENPEPEIIILEKGQCISPNLCIQSMILRQPVGPPSEAQPFGTAWTGPGGVAYTIYSALLELNFDQGGALSMSFGGAVRQRTIALTMARRNVGGLTDLCYQDQQAPPASVNCLGPGDLTAGNPDCPASVSPCDPLYFISGFDALGKPICRCQVACSTTN